MARKLDRVLINQVWLHTFSNSKVEFFSLSESNHCAVFVQLSKASYSPPKPFKFFDFWVKHSEFMDTVKASWEIREVGSPMVILHKKMKRLKPVLRAFNASRYAGISDKVKEKRKELDALQISILSNSLNTRLIDKEKVVTKELHELMKAEESFHRQKSRVQWLQERDFNTIFFHNMVAAKTKQNTISILKDAEGNILTTYTQISNEAVTYFQNLLRTTDVHVTGCNERLLEELLPDKLIIEASSEIVSKLPLRR